MGTVTSASYIQWVAPLIIECCQRSAERGVPLAFMQDGASPHRARATLAHFDSHNIRRVAWPPYSPDLNPIEHVWKVMKDWIARHYSEYTSDQSENRRIVQEAWAALPEDFFHKLVASMPERMMAVIRAHGMHTSY